MKLVQPIDFDILEQLADGKRDNASNLAVHLDRNRGYINTRLPMLAAYGLVERIGPAPRSGLYEITARGCAVVACQCQYTATGEFETLIESYVAARSETATD